MSTRLYPDLGRVWNPEPVISMPGRPTAPKHVGVVVASLRRPKWSMQDMRLEDVKDPALFGYEVIWTSITHNERVDKGGDITVNALFGTVGVTPNGVFIATAVATTGFTTKTHTDLSIGSSSANVTTNEFTTIGLSRASSTAQNYTAASTLNGTFSVDVFKSFSVSGSGTAHGAALYDQVTVSGSHLYCEDIYSSDAVCVSGDTLNNTWTVNA